MIINDFNLQGKVAIVTGAAKGLGQGMALGLAEAGADIVGVGHSTSLDDTQGKVVDLGNDFLPIYCDLRNTEASQDIVNKTLDHFGKINILVNNAGTLRREKAEDYSQKDWDDVMNVNLRSLFFLTQTVARYFIDQGKGGKIINICSMLSYSGGILVAPYTASKSGVAGLTRVLANEWGKYGINVNGIAPGYMATDLTQPLQQDEERNRNITARIPLGRWGDPEDLKGAVVFLASEASNYITGTIIRVDGGWLTR